MQNTVRRGLLFTILKLLAGIDADLIEAIQTAKLGSCKHITECQTLCSSLLESMVVLLQITRFVCSSMVSRLYRDRCHHWGLRPHARSAVILNIGSDQVTSFILIGCPLVINIPNMHVTFIHFIYSDKLCQRSLEEPPHEHKNTSVLWCTLTVIIIAINTYI